MDSELKSRFHRLCTAIAEKKNADETRALLRQVKGYVNHKIPNDADGLTTLILAAKLDAGKEILKLFTETKQIDLNVKDNRGMTALHYVIERENFEEAKILIEAGADVIVPNKVGKTPLHLLIDKHVNKKIIESLVNLKNPRGENSLFAAIKLGNIKDTQLLIDYGCDIKCVSSDGSTLLHEAAKSKIAKSHYEVAKVILKTGLDVNAQDLIKNTPLHYLVKQANSNIIELFLKYKASVNIKNDEGEIPLFNAINAGNLEAVQTLINHGSDNNSVSNNGLTVLQKAASFSKGDSHFQIVKLLLNAGADVNIKDNYGRTPLFSAVDCKNDEIVQLLLDCGSDINTVDEYGSTVLHCAKFTQNDNNLSTFEVLLKNGANVDAQDSGGKTPLHYLMIVFERNRNNAKTITLFLKYKPKVNIKDSDDESPLLSAIRDHNVKLVQLLADHGSDINCTDNYNQTPLHLAAAHYYTNSRKILKCLLKNGVDADARDSHGQTALLVLLIESSNTYNFDKILIFMLKYSDVNEIDQSKREILSRINTEEIWEIILEHLAKLLALELPINPAFENSIYNRTEYEDYFENCLEELAKAKNTKLKNCWVTFFNLLVDDRRNLKNYAGNFELIKEFEKSDCIEEFPIYGHSMEKNMKKGIERRKLFDKAAGMLSNNWPIFSPSHLIIRDTLDCILSTKDLSQFCEE